MLFVLNISLFGDIEAITESGKIVILHEDGTWSYSSKSETQSELLQILQMIFKRLNVLSGNGLEEARYKVEFIKPGETYTFLLKGGKAVAVIDFLTFEIGSGQCKNLMAEKYLEIIDALNTLFLNKKIEEITTPDGIVLTKKQIKDSVNRIIGFSGIKEQFGITNVYLCIKAVSSIE